MRNKKTRKARVYISGPMSGRTKKDYMLHFHRIEQLIRESDEQPVNLTRMWGILQPLFERIPYKYQVILDCLFLASCDEICLLKGHESSRGCALEKEVARWLNLRFCYE